MKKWGLFSCLRWGIFVAVAALLLGIAVMLLWNWLMPELFGIRQISFFQSLGLLALTRILFGGFKGGAFRGGEEDCQKGQDWKNRFKEKLETMTPEEKEKFKKYYYNKCCDEGERKEVIQ